MAAHPSTLAWKIPWREEPGRLESMGGKESDTTERRHFHFHSAYTVEVRNRFKGLDLIDGVPDELWTEVRDIVEETGIKTTPRKKKCKKAKRLSEDALQIAVKRRNTKSKGGKERYTHVNVEFQRIARRDKKAFLKIKIKKKRKKKKKQTNKKTD